MYINHYTGMPLEKITSTVGLNGKEEASYFDLCTLSVLCWVVARVDMPSIRMIFWDLGGQEDLQSLWDKVSQCTTCKTCATLVQCDIVHLYSNL